MGKLETPLTWVLAIGFVGYLFIANCECGENSTCSLNNGFNFESPAKNDAVLDLQAPEVEETNDSIDTIVVEANIDSSEVIKNNEDNSDSE